MPRKPSKRFAESIGNALGVDWDTIDFDQFHIGLGVELEHWETVDRNWYTIARIATDHLLEFPDYYTHLVAMEKRLKI
ncbi:MAG: DUF5661 family protein [Parcubacteria group bacterium]|jgi:hypothetical protein